MRADVVVVARHNGHADLIESPWTASPASDGTG